MPVPQHRICALVVMLVCLLCGMPARASAAGAPTHFILLLDDSGDMRGLARQMPQQISRWLFDGPDPTDPKTPRFNPSTDTLSVVFFALHPDRDTPDPCKTKRGFSLASPDYALQWQPVTADERGDRNRFASAMTGWLGQPCRFGGNASPIATSPLLALPYVDARIKDGRLHDRLVVAVASNEIFNVLGGSPSKELNRLERDLRVRDTGRARAVMEEVSRFFNLDAFPGWRATSSTRLSYEAFRVAPRSRPPDAAMVFNQDIELDRVAIDRTRLRAAPTFPGAADIRVPASELVPLSMSWEIQTAAGRPWDRGPSGSPTAGTVDFSDCQPPACTKTQSVTTVRLFDAARSPLEWIPGAASLERGSLRFTTAFRIDTNGRAYDHLRVESAPQTLAFAPVLPPVVRLLIFPLTVDDWLHASLFSSALDGQSSGLTSAAAATRLQFINLGVWVVSMLASASTLIVLARRSRVFSFAPVVEWRPASGVEIDFNRANRGRVLVGSFVVRNTGRLNALGTLLGRLPRRLGGAEQPTRSATLTLAGDSRERLAAIGVEIGDAVPLGFLQEKGELTAETREWVSDGRQVPVFVAEEILEDYAPKGRPVTKQMELLLQVPAQLAFDASDVASPRFATVSSEMQIGLRLHARVAQPPEVSFVAASSPLHYKRGAELCVGHFIFKSVDTRRFVLPFPGKYAIAGAREGAPLTGQALRLDRSEITLGSGETVRVPVILRCDAPEISNPDPMRHTYTFALIGTYTSRYAEKDLRFDLLRDPTRAELTLRLTYLDNTLEVFWNRTTSKWDYKRTHPSEAAAIDARGDADGLIIETPYPCQFTRDTHKPTLVDIEVGNSATAGRGTVAMTIDGRLRFAGSAEGRVHLLDRWTSGDLVTLRRYGGSGGAGFLVEEGKPAQRGDVCLLTDGIARIDGAEVPADECTAELTCTIAIAPDAGPPEQRVLKVNIPVHLEELPGRNWVVIDFGTSAISAAAGIEGGENTELLLDLQNIEVAEGVTLAKFDRHNSEEQTPFLPSWILCDADLRSTPTAEGIVHPPGFPRHTGPSGAASAPPDPSFVTLPAGENDFSDRQERVILSLKSWLGTNAESINLPSPIPVDGKLTRELKLDACVEAGYSALAEAYLKRHPAARAARQVVLCHPNSFGPMHRERLHGLACNALMGRLDIAAAKHVHLVSESDAVAYDYCWTRRHEAPPGSRERLLIFDMGAGTLDLSLIDVAWTGAQYPRFDTRHHLGVPIAGHYFDEVLGRVIHDALEAEGTLPPSIVYRYPIVSHTLGGDQPNHDSREEHLLASRFLWNAIRTAKADWDGRARFNVTVGRIKSGLGVVRRTSDLPIGESDVAVAVDAPAAIRLDRGTDSIVLSLPSTAIHGDFRIRSLLDFITGDVIDETVALASATRNSIDTVVLSGRASLWPGLKDLMASRVNPRARVVFAGEGTEMKAAVARGAIARQALMPDGPGDDPEPSPGMLALLVGMGQGRRLIPETDWPGPFEIVDPDFRIVQVALRRPDPVRDLAPNSLRRHFYIDVADREYERNSHCGPDRRLKIERINNGGVTTIKLTRTNGRSTTVVAGRSVAIPGWPMGSPLIAPDSEAVAEAAAGVAS